MIVDEREKIKNCRNTINEILELYIPSKHAKSLMAAIDDLIKLRIEKYDKSQAQW